MWTEKWGGLRLCYFVLFPTATGQWQYNKRAHPLPPCEGRFKGRRLTPKVIAAVLADHAAWQTEVSDQKMKLEATDNRRANLCGADLSDANLQEARLFAANLRG
jgi:pentapeptide repeat protein